MNLTKIAATVEKYMVDTCSIYSLNPSDPDPETAVVQDIKTVHYTGKCMVWQGSAQGNLNANIVRESMYQGAIPMAEDGVTENMIFEVTASNDTKLLGQKFIINAVGTQTYGVYRALDFRYFSTDN